MITFSILKIEQSVHHNKIYYASEKKNWDVNWNLSF